MDYLRASILWKSRIACVDLPQPSRLNSGKELWDKGLLYGPGGLLFHFYRASSFSIVNQP